MINNEKLRDNDSDVIYISKNLYNKLSYLGIIDDNPCRQHNVGTSDYAKHIIQPWTIWLAYPDLTPWDHDIIKRVLRTKIENNELPAQARMQDYQKIIHICEERIRQLMFDI